MSKQIIESASAPAPIGPYNQAVLTGNLLFVSGQVGLKPGAGDIEAGSIEEETRQVMENIRAILTDAAMDFSNVVKTTIFLGDMSLFGQVNEVYASYFVADFPARETVAVKGLPKNAQVEISVIAAHA